MFGLGVFVCHTYYISQKALYGQTKGYKMIFFKESTIYASYATLKSAKKRAAKLTACGATVVVELVGNVYMVVGA